VIGKQTDAIKYNLIKPYPTKNQGLFLSTYPEQGCYLQALLRNPDLLPAKELSPIISAPHSNHINPSFSQRPHSANDYFTRFLRIPL
jgi:hypothetical protein